MAIAARIRQALKGFIGEGAGTPAAQTVDGSVLAPVPHMLNEFPTRPTCTSPAVKQQQSLDQLFEIINTNQSAGGLRQVQSDGDARKNFFRWQYAGAMAIAEAMMVADWDIQERDSDGKWAVESPHPLETLLKDANPFMTGPELFLWTFCEVILIGKSWWAISKNGLNEPAELWPLIGTVTPIRDPVTLIKGWKQEAWVDGQHLVRTYEPEEIVYLRIPKPGDLVGGFGPVQAAGAAISLDTQIVESEWAAFKQGVFPTAVLMLTEQDAAKRQRAVEEFDKKYGGVEATGKSIGLNADRVKLEFPSRRPLDMGYHRSEEARRDEILATLRTPAAILGLSKDVNRASAAGMEYIFAKWRMAPLFKLLQARINQDLARPFYGPDTRLKFSVPIPEDEAAETEKLDMHMRHGIMTINEAREKIGLGPMPWGDRPYLPGGLLPVGSASAPQDGQALPSTSSTTDTAVAPETQAAVVSSAPPKGRTRKERAIIAWQHAEDRISLDRKFRRLFAKYFADLGSRVLEAWDKSEQQAFSAREVLILPAGVDRILDPAAMAADMARRAQPAVRGGLFLGGSFERGLTVDPAAMPWAADEQIIDEYVARHGASHYMGVADITRQQYVETVAVAAKANKSWDEIRLSIVDEIGVMKESRAANIAMTETTKIYGAGSQAFREKFEVPYKQWVASFVNTRDSHGAADGQVVGNDENFYVGDDSMAWPGTGSSAAENCNCACCAIGVLEK